MNVLLTYRERQLGVVGPFPVDRARWHDVAPVTEHLRELLGVPAVVLRLLDVQGGGGGLGGLVSYHAELLAEPPAGLALRPATPAESDALRPQPHRAEYATADGVRAALDWAEQALLAAGRPVTGPVEQVKTWNLAGLFRLPTAAGPVWLKTGRHFAVDEAAVIALFRAVAPESAPTVLAADPDHRLLLLDHVPGEDCWGPSAEVVADAVPRLVRAQAALAASYPGGAPAGLRDRAPAALVPAVKALLDGPAAAELTADELAGARAMVDRLPELVEQLASCGLPDVVLHGDFHPGNWRSNGGPAVLVDFADACFGHPALDGLRPKDFCSGERWAQAAATWCEAWRTVVPGSDPERALRLAAPFSHLGYAVRYQEFLDAIEPSEYRYHAGDPAAELRAALAAFAAV
ncbi:aminoglycoside phosphotransferase family protein [Kitasatospora acidiphila]|uniref:Aminoglycoside phosphotransferase family protein n=1 Tax=Kitasatospora acidiphila TaxID=2567942 RepID=A0A540W486_9ACTN|nr:aminoglycoside phosphotransferase family protein [Kitasatospora acidiphila]TQF03727.1 aminoglycoside phosphotransferase family protein [Kitasatospora acidiphila]